MRTVHFEGMKEKQCRSCGVIKSVTEFRQRKRSKSLTYISYCNYCEKICKKEMRSKPEFKIQSGLVRKLLCTGCNNALGIIKEQYTTAINLANYIKTYKEVDIHA